MSGLLLFMVEISASSREFAQSGLASYAISLLVEMLAMELELLSRPLEGAQAQPAAAVQSWASP